MSKFGYLIGCYVFFVCVVIATNTWLSTEGKPILNLGILIKWWFALILILFAYISEWIAIIYKGGE